METTPTKISPFRENKKESKSKRATQRSRRVGGLSYETVKGKPKPEKKAPLNIVSIELLSLHSM